MRKRVGLFQGSNTFLHSSILSAANCTEGYSSASRKMAITAGLTEEESYKLFRLSKVLKFNPYHDGLGKFTSRDTASASSKMGNKLGKSIYDRAVVAEPKITQDVVGAVHGKGRLAGLDFRIKTLESLQGKIVRDTIEKRISSEKAASVIGDSVRYTAEVPTEGYTQGVKSILATLYSKGYRLNKPPRNAWQTVPLTDYQGVNTQLKDPNGFIFELQFHTPESFYTKEVVNHKLYEKARAVGTTPKEADKLKAEMIANQLGVPIPLNVRAELSTYFDKLTKT